ncbi:DMT family transporter [Bacillus carboniphilus]|uniref:DMT family transporter n=1 Tax=Bacillus carboniphilus TaxID=86663 RepID=A0ABN0VSW6_9BACI
MKDLRIYIILTIVMFVWGVNLPIVKYLTAQMGPVTMTALRILIAATTVFIILAIMGLIRKPSRKEWLYIGLGAVLNVALHHYFISVGLTMTSGTNAGLILGTGPMLTAIFGSLILRLFPTKLQWIGFLLGLSGVSLTVIAGNGGASSVSLGDLFVFLAIFAQVLSFMVITKAAKTMDPRLLTAYMFLFGSILLFITGFIQEPGEMAAFATVPGVFWLAILASGMGATAVGHMLYNFSIGIVGPSKSAIFINLNTVFSLIGAAILLNEKITSIHLIGLVLIIGGVLLGSGAVEQMMKNRKKKKAISTNAKVKVNI